MPSLLRTNPEIAERKRTASIQRKRMAAVDKAPKEDIRRPLDLEVDDAALDSDHRGVRAVVSAELRQYAPDPAFDSLFGE